MDELIKFIEQKTGISPDKARSAANAAVEFLKNRLPEPIASQIDNAIGGGGTEDSSGIASGLQNLVGGPTH
jgi:hypothetical protein